VKRIHHAATRLTTPMKYSTHENFSPDEAVSIGSDRSFGLVMAAGFAVLASFSVWREGRAWLALATVGTLFLVTALLIPAALNPLNRAWLKLGLLLHKIVNPVVMGLVFYGAVLPTGLVMRAMGRDLLRLKPQPKAESYWIVRTPPGPAPKTMKDQF
jgi:Saxitoxin biosynthesis operon protein SxtJ